MDKKLQEFRSKILQGENFQRPNEKLGAIQGQPKAFVPQNLRYVKKTVYKAPQILCKSKDSFDSESKSPPTYRVNTAKMGDLTFSSQTGVDTLRQNNKGEQTMLNAISSRHGSS